MGKQNGEKNSIPVTVVTCAIVFTAFIGILTFLCFPPYFATNDDVMLKAIVSGEITGSPEAHLVYIMYPLGLILKLFYSIIKAVPWYDFFMMGMHLIAYVLLIIRVGEVFHDLNKTVFSKLTGNECLKPNQKSFGKAGCFIPALAAIAGGLLLLIVDYKYLVLHQYTSLAATLVAVALFYVLTARIKDGALCLKDCIIVGILLILTLWMRKQVFFMAVPLFVLAVVYRILIGFRKNSHGNKGEKALEGNQSNVQTDNRKTEQKNDSGKADRQNYGKWFIFPSVIIVIALLSILADKLAYSEEGWKSFFAYNDARTDVYDYYGFPNYGEYTDEYDALGIKETDLYPLGEWDLALFEDCKKDSMQELADFTGSVWKSIHYQKWEIRHTALNVFNLIIFQDVQPIGWILAIVSVLAPVLLFIAKRRNAAVIILFALLYEGAFVTYFVFRTRFPERVSYGLYLMVFAFVLAIVLQELEGVLKENRVVKAVLANKKGTEDSSAAENRTDENSTSEKTEDITEDDADESERAFINRVGIIMRVVPIAIIVILTVSAIIRICLFQPTYEETRLQALNWEECNSYFANHPEKVYYLKTATFAPFGEKMFKTSTFEEGNILRMGTWIMGSPLYDAQLRSRGNKPWEAIVTDEKIYYVQDPAIDTEWIVNFYKGQGMDVTVETVDGIMTSDGRVFPVYDISP